MTYKIVMIFAQVGYVWWPRAAMVKKKKTNKKSSMCFRKILYLKKIVNKLNLLTLSWRRPLSYRNQSNHYFKEKNL